MKGMTIHTVMGGAISLGLALVLTGCSPSPSATNAVTGSTAASNASSVSGKVSLSLMNADGSLVYSDSSGSTSSALKLVAGKIYQLKLAQANGVSGTSYSLIATQTNVVGGASFTVPLQLGSNSFTVPAQGDYSLKIVSTPPGGAAVSTYYLAQVTCASPTFTASSLTASKIMVSAGSTANLFNLSAAGVTASANGQAPYSCAWDPTGTGIQDTAFQSCDSPVNNFYSNFLGSRKVGLIVKDACNSTYSISNAQVFNSTAPSMPGNVFISAVVSNAAGLSVGDARVDGVNYLATNTTGNNPVQPNYNGGSFQIYSLVNYGQPSSVQFGMQIKLKGIIDSINVSAGTGTIDASKAVISNVAYITDQAGDKNPTVSYSSSSCVLSNQGALVKYVAGQPCTAGMSGDNNKATVEVYGHYVCSSVSTNGGSVSIQGDFDGYTDLVDNCSGGGGGGGGIVPIKL